MVEFILLFAAVALVGAIIGSVIGAKRARRRQDGLAPVVEAVAERFGGTIKNPGDRGEFEKELHLSIDGRDGWVEFRRQVEDGESPRALFLTDVIWLDVFPDPVEFQVRPRRPTDEVLSELLDLDFSVEPTDPWQSAVAGDSESIALLCELGELSTDDRFQVSPHLKSFRVRITGWPTETGQLTRLVELSYQLCDKFARIG